MSKSHIIIIGLVCLVLSSCENRSAKPPYNLGQQSSTTISIPYLEVGGIKTIPVKLNGVTMSMIYDTGCSGVHLSLNELQILEKMVNLVKAIS